MLTLCSLMDYKPTGDPELDNAKRKKLEAELARVVRNVDRRQAREKAKGRLVGASATGSPDAEGLGSTDHTPLKPKRNKDGGTSRKCANCGQTGHIKTNRKSVTKPYFCPHCFRWTLYGEVVEKNGGREGLGGGSNGAVSTNPQDAAPISFL